MKRFFLKLAVFLLPILLTGIPLISLLWYMGLLFPFPQIARLQSQDELLYAVTVEESGYYKADVIATYQPDVIVLGSSRMLSFRAEFCNRQPETFYNAGLRTLDNESMAYFGRRFIDAHAPDVLLLGLDQPYFTLNYERPYVDLIDDDFSQNDYILSQVKGFLLHIPQLKNSDLMQLWNRREPILEHPAIGTFAILNGVGHRSDGSFQYGQAEVNARVIGSITTPDILYQPASEISETALAYLDELLAYAQENDVEVIGFFPPFSPDIYNNTYLANPEDFTYLPLLTNRIESLFDDYGYSFYDFTDPASLGISDEIMLDGWHISERSSLMLYMELLENEAQALESCSDADYLQSLLDNSEHPFFVAPR